jgi:hypothetical protein
MPSLHDRLVTRDDQICLRSNDNTATELLAKLEAGASPKTLIERGLDPADLIAALAWTALGDDGSLGPGLVQGKPPRPGLSQALSETTFSAVFPRVSETSRLALLAGLLQVLDFWDSSHTAAQRADDLGERDFSAYWHGIAHRREPDAGNATYWFRRVGRHPVFSSLAAAALPLLEEHNNPALSRSLIDNGQWNSFAMIELCTRARAGTASETLARRLQRLELWLLLDATFAALESS